MKRRLLWIFILACLVLAAATVFRPAVDRLVFFYHLAMDDPPAHLPVPVAGVEARALVDTWGAPRAPGRRHQGINIFAARGTAVRSTTRGIVTRVGTNALGGQVVWILGPGLEAHYYAHLDRFSEIREGDVVQAGDVVGYVGRSGNARTTPYHLHYGIYRRGRAENPYPRLTN